MPIIVSYAMNEVAKSGQCSRKAKRVTFGERLDSFGLKTMHLHVIRRSVEPTEAANGGLFSLASPDRALP